MLLIVKLKLVKMMEIDVRLGIIILTDTRIIVESTLPPGVVLNVGLVAMVKK